MIQKARAAYRALCAAGPAPHALPRDSAPSTDRVSLTARLGWAWAWELSSNLQAGRRVGSLSGPPLPRPCRTQRLAQQQ